MRWSLAAMAWSFSSSSVCQAGCPVVVDVRTLSEWNMGHLPCAHRLPVQSDASLVGRVQCLAGGKSADPIYVYCRSGTRAGNAVSVLENAGFTTATNKGGYVDVLSLDLCDCTPQNACAAAPSSSSSSSSKRVVDCDLHCIGAYVGPARAPARAKASPLPGGTG